MTTHAVVVGSGIAGLTVALHAVASGCRVTLVTKDELAHANTRFAQGGIAAVMFDDDHVEDHIRDTLIAGAGLCDPEAVRVLAEEGPARIRELVALGVAFDRDPDGDWVKGLEAAHSYPRILHAGGDATGTAIERALVARLRASAVEVIEHAFLVDLVSADGRVTGVDLLVGERTDDGRADGEPDAGTPRAQQAGCRRVIAADAVVLATGGAGELYAHTTNPPVATADGIAAALRAGAGVTELEFFQFHPTVLAAGAAFLVSEAVRGEGAVLRDESGRPVMAGRHPDGDLAPRDVVARAIAEVMAQQHGRPVLLDATGLRPTVEETARFLAARFPTIDAAVRDRGLNWAREPIPVTPAAHYLMGGIVTDLWGRTSLPGLYAVGEVARTGVHGANRLASNSLLEGAVFGARAGDTIAADVAARRPADLPGPTSLSSPTDPTRSVAPAAPARHSASTRGQAPYARPTNPSRIVASTTTARHSASTHEPFTRAALQELLWKHAGLVRDAAGLAQAAASLAGWGAAPRTPRTEADYEDENLLQVAAALVAAAQARTGSVGAHFRSDDPAGAFTTPQKPALSAPEQPDPDVATPFLRSFAHDSSRKVPA